MARGLVLALGILIAPVSLRAACLWGDVAGYDCGQVTAEGCCKDGTERYWCEGGVLCVEECWFGDCGWTLLDGYTCDTLMGLYSNDCPPIPTTCDPCGDVTDAGCCDGDMLTWCEDGCLRTIDCFWNDPPDDVCGWEAGYGFYDCGGDGADPSGVNPWACDGACVPDCTGRECGWNGCDGFCGTCPGGETCIDGTCEPGTCVPDCALRDCGPDGCGGSCGDCPQGTTCVDGGCEQDVCVPACAGKACGADGCGGSCGTCLGGTVCEAGACVQPPCVPACAGRSCGPDGCGGSCGDCLEGWTCRDGSCIQVTPCEPQCAGRVCGPDGCDGVCGVCISPRVCNDEGRCVDPQTCIPACGNRACGSDGCGGSCGTCDDGATCVSGVCRAETLPDAGTPDRDDGAPADPGGADAAPVPECPPGQILRYGQCVEPDLPPAAADRNGGGCGAGAPGGAGAWLPGAMLLALALALARRRGARG